MQVKLLGFPFLCKGPLIEWTKRSSKVFDEYIVYHVGFKRLLMDVKRR